MKRQLLAGAAFAAALMMGGAASAQQCQVDAESPWDMDEAAVNAFYDCMKDWIAECYARGGNDVAKNYRSWTVSSTRPAVAGPHSERFLQTFANDIAAGQYLKFESEGVEMPAGSILAKESFSIKNGKGVVGPLFIMTKLEEGASPKTNDWHYSGIDNSGGEMKVSQSFCSNCHANWKAQDDLAYPMEEVRVSN